jgi:hypothetical protein
MADWVTRAAQAHAKIKAEAVIDAACTLADLLDREVTFNEMISAALRETVNQYQSGMGLIHAPDIYYLAKVIETLADEHGQLTGPYKLEQIDE